MRVRIDHEEETRGFIGKTTYHVVQCTVEFSEEERQVITTQNLQREIVLERSPDAVVKIYENDPPEKFFLTIRDLLKGPDRYFCRSIAEAKIYENDLLEALPLIKQGLTMSAEIEEKSKTFEF